MPQQMGVGGQPDAGGQGEGAAGVVGVDRRAPLGAEDRVQLDRPGGRPGSTQRNQRVEAWPRLRRSRCCWRCWRSTWTAKGGRVRMALLAGEGLGNRMVPASRSRSVHSRPHSSPLRAPVAAARTVQVPSHGLEVWSAASSGTATCSGGQGHHLGAGQQWWGGMGGGVVGDPNRVRQRPAQGVVNQVAEARRRPHGVPNE
jgi:hypothetical protein